MRPIDSSYDNAMGRSSAAAREALDAMAWDDIRNQIEEVPGEGWRLARTTAERISDQLGNDGMIFSTSGGRSLEELCEEASGRESRARIRYNDDTMEERVEEVSRGEQIFDRQRWSFVDGSAIVVAGDAWDIEGEEPFSWLGA